jgi:hypothetical protein
MKFSRTGDLAPGICASLISSITCRYYTEFHPNSDNKCGKQGQKFAYALEVCLSPRLFAKTDDNKKNFCEYPRKMFVYEKLKEKED